VFHLVSPPRLHNVSAGTADTSAANSRWAGSLDGHGAKANVYIGANGINELISADGVHMIAESYVSKFSEVGEAVAVNFYGASGVWQFPKPGAAVRSGARSFKVAWSLYNGGGIRSKTGTLTGITGFRVASGLDTTVDGSVAAPCLDRATLLTITSAVIVSRTEVEVTTTTDLPTPFHWDYLGDHEPDISNMIYDNATHP
jgi:hypothetical protein